MKRKWICVFIWCFIYDCFCLYFVLIHFRSVLPGSEYLAFAAAFLVCRKHIFFWYIIFIFATHSSNILQLLLIHFACLLLNILHFFSLFNWLVLFFDWGYHLGLIHLFHFFIYRSWHAQRGYGVNVIALSL